MSVTPNQLIKGIQTSLSHLIISSAIHYDEVEEKEFIAQYGNIHPRQTLLDVNDTCFLLILPRAPQKIRFYSIKRPESFTNKEKKTLKSAASVISDVMEFDNGDLSLYLMGALSLGSLIVTRILRRTTATKFTVTFQVLKLLIDFSFNDYEGIPATSGILYTSEPIKFIEWIKKQEPYNYIPFRRPIPIDSDLYKNPLSHMHVDGCNTFYLGASDGNILGVIVNTHAASIDIFERCTYQHVSELLSGSNGRTWCAMVGRNRRVHIRTKSKTTFIWDKNHWAFVDPELVRRILREYGCTVRGVQSIEKLICTASDTHMGMALLIREADQDSPKASSIDHSQLGNELKKQINGQHLDGLMKSHRLLGIASSDGLCELDLDGVILETGKIIDITETLAKKHAKDHGGGGRTKAAIAASYYGLSIKVSEDGPITFYRKGKLILRMP